MELTEYKALLDGKLSEASAPERGMYTKTEVLDILLDLRNLLPASEPVLV